MKTILEIDESQIHQQTQKLRAAVPLVQQIVDEYNSYQIDPLRSKIDLQNLIENGSEFVRKKIESMLQPKEIKVGLRLFKKTTSAMMKEIEEDLPNMDRLNELCELARQNNYQYTVRDTLSFSGGKVEIGSIELTAIRESCTRYARDKQEEALLATAQETIKCLNKLEALAQPVLNRKQLYDEFGELGIILKRMFYNDGNGWKIRPGFFDQHSYDMQIAFNLRNKKQLA